MRIKLGRRENVVRLPFTGRTFCGCHYFQGALFDPCGEHKTAKHRIPFDFED